MSYDPAHCASECCSCCADAPQLRRDLEAMTADRDRIRRQQYDISLDLIGANARCVELEKANKEAETEFLRELGTSKRYREALEYWNRWSTGGNFDGKEAERLTKAALSATPLTRAEEPKDD